ncbi:glycosyltransferase [Winogradskyella sp. PC D3.3]
MVSFVFIFIIIIYLFIIGGLNYGFDKIEEFNVHDLPSKTKFSVIIPFRNETKNLPQLLDSILGLHYPKSMFEVILVDDDSEDDSVAIITNYLDIQTIKQGFPLTDYISIIKNKRHSNSPKKDAITTAIQHSKCNWIITTDADCVLPKYWLDTFDKYIQTQHPNCIVAPVTYHGKMTFLNRFQTLDILSLQGSTIGSFGIKKPLMCNGANFAYLKSQFNRVKGFEGNNRIASGDDVFLLEKFIKHDAKKVNYLKSKNAIVTTNPSENIKELIQQRLRWASKTSQNKNWFVKLVGLVVLLGNAIFLGLLPAVYFNLITLKIAMALLIIKLSIDFLLIFKTTRFFKQKNLLRSYLFSSVLYPFFNVSVALLGFFKSYEWKGRTFKV